MTRSGVSGKAGLNRQTACKRRFQKFSSNKSLENFSKFQKRAILMVFTFSDRIQIVKIFKVKVKFHNPKQNCITSEDFDKFQVKMIKTIKKLNFDMRMLRFVICIFIFSVWGEFFGWGTIGGHRGLGGRFSRPHQLPGGGNPPHPHPWRPKHTGEKL